MLKFKIFNTHLNSKADNIKLLFLLQVFVILASATYLGVSNFNIVNERYHLISGDTILTGLLILSGLVGIGSIFLFSELVKLIEKEQEYEFKKLEVAQMEEANNLLRSQKHDFSNNLQVIWGMLSLGDIDKTKEYINHYTNMLKIDEEDLQDISNINNEYLYTLFINKAYKCKDMEIDIHYSIEPDLCFESYNPIDLIRIFGNLLDNAIYAVKGIEREDREILVDIYSDENNYCFSISNKGPKIPDEIRRDIFKAGFTTKGEDGSGMGLYNVIKLANKYMGNVVLENNDYLGTQFVVQMPKLDPAKSSFRLDKKLSKAT